MIRLLLCCALSPAPVVDDPVLAWVQEIEFEVQPPALWRDTTGLQDGGSAVLVDVVDEAADRTRPMLVRLGADGSEAWRADAAPNSPAGDAFGVDLFEQPGGARLYALGIGLDPAGQPIGTLEAFAPASGASLWSAEIQGASALPIEVQALAAAPDASRVYALSAAPYASGSQGPVRRFRVDAFDAADGTALWTTSLGASDLSDAHPVGLEVSGASGRIVLHGASIDGTSSPESGKARPFAAALEPDGAIAWQYAGASASSLGAARYERAVAAASGSAGFFTRGSGLLVAFDLDQGQPVWSAAPGHTLDYLGLDGGGPIVAGVTFDGAVVTAYTGLGPAVPPRWTRTLGGLPFGPALALGFEGPTGSALAIAFAIAPASQGGDAAYFELDTSDGSVLSTAELPGPQPGALALGIAATPGGARVTFAPQAQLPSPPSILARAFGSGPVDWVAPVRFSQPGRGAVAELSMSADGATAVTYERSLEAGGALDPCCRVRFLDAASGETLVEHLLDRALEGLDGRPAFAAAPDASFAAVVVETEGARLQRLDGASATVAWELDIAAEGLTEIDLISIDPTGARIALTDSTDVYPLPSGFTYAHRVLMIDAATGAVLWNRIHSLDLIGSRLDAVALRFHPANGDLLLLSRGEIPTIVAAIEMVAFRTDGSERWRTLLPPAGEADVPVDLVLLDDGQLLGVPATREPAVGSTDLPLPLVAFFDASDGQVLQVQEFPAQFFFGPSTAIEGAGELAGDALVLLSSETATIENLGVATGVRFGATAPEWTYPLGSANESAVARFDAASGRTALSAGLATLAVLSASGGQELVRFDLEPLPLGTALPAEPSRIVPGGPGLLLSWQTSGPEGPIGQLFGYALGSLLTGDAQVSLQAGGSVDLSLDFPPAPAPATPPRIGAILGTAGPTQPGLPIDQVVLPLTLDGYFLKTFSEANSGIFQGTVQQLDVHGNLQARLVVPPGLPASLAGLTLHHAALAFTLGGPADLVSNASPITLVP